MKKPKIKKVKKHGIVLYHIIDPYWPDDHPAVATTKEEAKKVAARIIRHHKQQQG